MKEADATRFVAGLNTLAATFRAEMSKATQVAYFNGLKRVSIDDFEAAVNLAISTCEKMPVPAQLKKLATKAWAEREGMYFLEGTGWVQDPYSDGAKRKRLEEADEARRLLPWPEEDAQ